MSQNSSKIIAIAVKSITTLILVAYGYGVLKHIFPIYPIALVYAVMSLITFIVYDRDKTAARLNDWRTPEATLHILELLGGWPGALLGQFVFWHKIRELSFQFVFWLIVIFHCTLWYTVYNEAVWRQTREAMPTNITALLGKLPLPKVPELFQFILKAQASSAPPVKASPPEQLPRGKVAEPSLDEIWAEDPVTEPLVFEPGVRRSLVIPPRENRRITGEIKAVSPLHGVLVALPPNVGGFGVIAPATLVADFYRRFQAGETIIVAIKGVKMNGTRKQMDVLLVEP